MERDCLDDLSFWKTNDRILKALRRRSWQTAKEVSETEGVKVGCIYNALNSLMRRGLIRRVRIRLTQVGRARPADYVYGLSSRRDPKRLTIVDEAELHWTALQKSIDVLRDLGYSIDLEVHLPEKPKVLPVVHVDGIEEVPSGKQILEVVAK